jgi:hypothetical protein
MRACRLAVYLIKQLDGKLAAVFGGFGRCFPQLTCQNLALP